ncbi:hypothetical protein MO867_20970 [Microbulbifer sp. OS29]|uniref:Uncharacterized protein n=1 Tax=Microbulbifer okhotskensis TaxID=2926617 RepID=A0A9X2EVP1_9GAMM|nr:DUF6631 family protein [Microbulbifer okhotskensis]MCO1336803.1 hypothetical protein [Microbulbifer okhotskensis]
MAKKLEKKVSAESQDDLEILHPERTLTIAGEKITVREYGFVEGLRLRPLAAPFLKALHQVMGSGATLSLEAVLDIIAEHHEIILQLMAVAIDCDENWLHGLNDPDGNLLLMTWWAVTGPFFLRSVQQRRIAELVASRAQKPVPAGEISTPP